MREDLKYIDNLIKNKNYTSHPSDQEIADFIDNKLSLESREKILEHIVHCQECNTIVTEVMKSQNSSKPANNPSHKPYNQDEYNDHYKHQDQAIAINNTWYKPALVASLIAASFLIFITLPSNESSLGIIDLSKPPTVTYQGSQDIKLINQKIDADKVLQEIVSSTSLAHITHYNEAQKALKNKQYDVVKGLYKQTLIQIATTEFDTQKRLREKVVVHNQLLQLSIQQDLTNSIQEYKDILRFEIRTYMLNQYKNKGEIE